MIYSYYIYSEWFVILFYVNVVANEGNITNTSNIDSSNTCKHNSYEHCLILFLPDM